MAQTSVAAAAARRGGRAVRTHTGPTQKRLVILTCRAAAAIFATMTTLALCCGCNNYEHQWNKAVAYQTLCDVDKCLAKTINALSSLLYWSAPTSTILWLLATGPFCLLLLLAIPTPFAQ